MTCLCQLVQWPWLARKADSAPAKSELEDREKRRLQQPSGRVTS
jgi:hypothetical protein